MSAKLRGVYVAAEAPTALVPFYEALLGAGPNLVDADHWIEFPKELGRLAIAGPRESCLPAPATVLILEVDNLAAALETVARHGGAIVNQRDMGSHGVSVTICDPAGGLLQLYSKV
jgi:predicted enzyme related to lactoylglutathione lyase